jgi:hypothetical protein
MVTALVGAAQASRDLQATRNSIADRATTTFLDWAALRNPALGRDDRSINDQALVLRDGAFHVFASQRFEVLPTPPLLVFRSSDLRTWEELPWPWTETAEGPIVSYAGSDDGDSFDLRGHGRVGLARDLVHWRLPGDLRD